MPRFEISKDEMKGPEPVPVGHYICTVLSLMQGRAGTDGSLVITGKFKIQSPAQFASHAPLKNTFTMKDDAPGKRDLCLLAQAAKVATTDANGRFSFSTEDILGKTVVLDVKQRLWKPKPDQEGRVVNDVAAFMSV